MTADIPRAGIATAAATAASTTTAASEQHRQGLADVELGLEHEAERGGPALGIDAGERTTAHRALRYVTGHENLGAGVEIVEAIYAQPRLDEPGDVWVLGELAMISTILISSITNIDSPYIAPDAKDRRMPQDKTLLDRFFSTDRDRTVLLQRLARGTIMLPHGAQKLLGWFGGPGFSGTRRFFTESIHLPAPIAARGTAFSKPTSIGSSVALSADGLTLAVGAIGEDSMASGIGGNQADNSGPNSGAVYLFARSSAAWAQQAYVKASNPDWSDSFGFAVALSADGATLAVTAPVEASTATGVGGDQTSNAVPGSGAVYVFARGGLGAWAQQAYIKAGNTDRNDGFGQGLALSADGATLAVGALFEDSAVVGPVRPRRGAVT